MKVSIKTWTNSLSSLYFKCGRMSEAIGIVKQLRPADVSCATGKEMRQGPLSSLFPAVFHCGRRPSPPPSPPLSVLFVCLRVLCVHFVSRTPKESKRERERGGQGIGSEERLVARLLSSLNLKLGATKTLQSRLKTNRMMCPS